MFDVATARSVGTSTRFGNEATALVLCTSQDLDEAGDHWDAAGRVGGLPGRLFEAKRDGA